MAILLFFVGCESRVYVLPSRRYILPYKEQTKTLFNSSLANGHYCPTRNSMTHICLPRALRDLDPEKWKEGRWEVGVPSLGVGQNDPVSGPV